MVAGLAVYADFTKMLEVLSTFNWWLMPIILFFTLFNYALRFYKWDVYLRLVGATGVSKRNSARSFFSGMAMAITPGKVGELLKSYLLKQIRGTPIATSAPIIMAERLTDGLAMLVLASVGLVLFDYGTPILVAIAIFAVLFLVVFQNRALFNRLLSMGERLPVVSKAVHHFHAFYDSSYELFRLPNLLFGVGIGVVSWSGEVVAFVLVMLGLGMQFSWILVIICAFHPLGLQPYWLGHTTARRPRHGRCQHHRYAPVPHSALYHLPHDAEYRRGRHPPDTLLHPLVWSCHRPYCTTITQKRLDRLPAPPASEDEKSLASI